MRIWPQRPSDDHAWQHVVAYDIETIVEQEMEDGSFPPWPRHRPVAASFLAASWTETGYVFRLDTITCEPGGEARFLGDVDAALSGGVTGVTYNGKGFDNPVLRLHAMAQQRFNLPGLARQAQAGRYAAEHCDLADQMSSYGSTRRVSLAELCEPLGIPVKTSVSGGDVGELWRAGEAETVRRYVEEDVLATYVMWLHWSAFRASREDLIIQPLADLALWVETGPGREHLLPFATCAPARWARSRAPCLRIAAALEDAERRVQRERDARAFAGESAF